MPLGVANETIAGVTLEKISVGSMPSREDSDRTVSWISRAFIRRSSEYDLDRLKKGCNGVGHACVTFRLALVARERIVTRPTCTRSIQAIHAWVNTP